MPLSHFEPEDAVEVLHGVSVADPYRWLEDRNNPLTEAWISEQKLRHDAYFVETEGLGAVRSRVSTYLDVDVVDQCAIAGQKFFYRLRKKQQQQACICIKDLTSGEERVLVDPSSQGPFSSVAIHQISGDGSRLAYELKRGGHDLKEIHVVMTADGQEFPDCITAGYAKGFAFAPDGLGFYYCHENRCGAEEHMIRFHRFGVSDDLLLLRRPRTSRSRMIMIADEVHLGAIYIREQDVGYTADLYLAEYASASDWTQVFAHKALPYGPLLHGGRIFVLTRQNAPNGKVLELAKDGREIRVVVSESEYSIQQIAAAGDTIYGRCLMRRRSIIRRWTLDGTHINTVALPARTGVQILPNLTRNPSSLFYRCESFTEPPHIHQLESKGTGLMSYRKSCFSTDTQSYRVCEVQYRSNDGTKIPMFLVMRRDLSPTGPSPAILTSYGAFGVSMTPQFSVLVAVLLELGVIFALPSIRGGSEFGRNWHDAARKRNRQVAIDDFIAAAEWVSHWNLRSPRPLGTFGVSTGGLLVASAMTQRPDLFRAVLCITPLLDMVRYELFDRARRWDLEFGRCDDPEDFAATYAYSPYHRIREHVNYPASLFVSGDCDDRCSPAHVRKMAARLQHRQAQTRSILVDYSAERGHSPVMPLAIRTEALTRRIAFLSKELGISISGGAV